MTVLDSDRQLLQLFLFVCYSRRQQQQQQQRYCRRKGCIWIVKEIRIFPGTGEKWAVWIIMDASFIGGKAGSLGHVGGQWYTNWS